MARQPLFRDVVFAAVAAAVSSCWTIRGAAAKQPEKQEAETTQKGGLGFLFAVKSVCKEPIAAKDLWHMDLALSPMNR